MATPFSSAQPQTNPFQQGQVVQSDRFAALRPIEKELLKRGVLTEPLSNTSKISGVQHGFVPGVLNQLRLILEGTGENITSLSDNRLNSLLLEADKTAQIKESKQGGGFGGFLKSFVKSGIGPALVLGGLAALPAAAGAAGATTAGSTAGTLGAHSLGGSLAIKTATGIKGLAGAGGLLGIDALGPAQSLPSFNTLNTLTAAGTGSGAGAGATALSLKNLGQAASAASNLSGLLQKSSTPLPASSTFAPKATALLSRNDFEIQESARKVAEAERERRGRQATILTSARGVTSPLGVSRPAGRQATLLG